MTDFETRLTDALTSGADRAPEPDGLAAGARSRARTRRRARVVVAACAVVVLAVPVAVLAVSGGDDSHGGIANDPAERNQATGWHTVEHKGIVVDIPGSWQALDTSGCDFGFVRFGPAEVDACTFDHEGLGFYASANFDPKHGPGLVEDEVGWSGYVYAGDWAVYATVGDQDRARRILASAREEGQQAPDVSAGWRTESYGGLSIDVPADWQEGGLSAWCLDESVPGWIERPDTEVRAIACSPRTGYGIRFDPQAGGSNAGFTEQHGQPYREGSWAGIALVPDGNGTPVGYVQVVAPTQGLAELIGGSLRTE